MPGASFEGRYEILAKLGEGGFGAVYEARQRTTGQVVALKVMRSPSPGEAARTETRVARFLREARLSAQLHHPNIVQLVDSGQTAEGSLYTVFSFAPGDDLAAVLAREGALAPREARHLMLQVLDALACAHAQGVVHRDLKPGNIMVVPTGARRNAVVLDFGIGALTEAPAESGERLTGSHDTLGTPGYGAPEQWRGLEPTARADLFSWGLVFLECLLGRPVYRGTAAEMFYQLLGPDPVPLPPALERHPLGDLLRSATRKDVGARDVTAKGLLEALEACDLRGLSREVLQGGEEGALADAAPTASLDRTSAAPAGERRQVTALGCRVDIETMSPKVPTGEEVDDALRTALTIGTGVARRHRGHVVSALGDTLLVYFGYPRAEEDDAVRAGRAALAIARAVQAENEKIGPCGVCLEVGIGLHTGLVTTGDVELGMGATPRLAIRVGVTAAAGSVAVTGESQRLLRGAFELTATDEGFIAEERVQVDVFRLHRERAPETPGSTREGSRAPLVGRDQELELLLERWRRVQAGAGQCSLITGEPGIGKSRLVRELRRRAAGDAPRLFEGRCSPQAQNTALFPIVELLGSALGLDQEVEAAGKIARLEAELTAQGLTPTEELPLLLPLFSLPLAEPYAASAVPPQQQKARTLDALVSLLFGMAAQEPLLLLVEDLHWADPTTLEMLAQLVREVPEERVLLLMTARPEFSPSFSTTGMLQLHLGRLERPQIEALVTELAGRKALPAAALDQVVSRTDGVPLFVEELTQMILESGALVPHGDGYDLARPLSDVELPGTLRALLTVRLDGLGRAKETAQLAAALGREFEVELLSAVSPAGAAAVQEDLDRLIAAGLVLRRRRAKDPTRTFKHALVRDAAYESLGRAARLGVHARIAEVLGEKFPAMAEGRPEMMAHHLAAAEKKREAVGWAKKAVQQAMDRSAYVEAVRRGREAIGWLGAVEEVEEREDLELSLGSQMTLALLAQGSSGAEELARVAERTLDLVDRRGDRADAGPMLWRLLLYYMHVSPEKAREVAERLLRIAERSNDVGEQAALLAIVGNCLWVVARFEEARSRLEGCLALYDPGLHRTSALKYGIDTKVCALAALAPLAWITGQPDAGLRYAQDAVAWAKEIAHPLSLSNALLALAGLHQSRMETEEAAWVSTLALRDARKHGPVMEAYHGIIHAWATKDLDEAHRHLGTLRSMGTSLGMTVWLSIVAEVEAHHGHQGAALEHLEECKHLASETGETYWLSEIYRRHGSILATHDLVAAKPLLQQAVIIAQNQGAQSAELCARNLLEELTPDAGTSSNTAIPPQQLDSRH